MYEDILRPEEQVTLSLRSLYERHGYKKYRMSRFEEYDLYLDNKAFLPTRHMITFNDLDGHVMALKPDVTLSIVKNTRATSESSEKLYYLENVYRLDRKSRAYREISQLGLECFGRLDDYALGEAVALAAQTLGAISHSYRMAVSHTGFVLTLLEGLSISSEASKALIACVRARRSHEILSGAADFGLTPAVAEMLSKIADLSGPFPETIERARAYAIMPSMSAALDQLASVYAQLDALGLSDNVRLDFSVINDLDYYSGILLQGYVEGIPRPVLSGGYYGSLLKKFGRDLDAIGFAVYLNELAGFFPARGGFDADALVLCGAGEDPRLLAKAAAEMREKGLRVRVERSAPSDFHAEKTYRFENGALREVPYHA